LVEAFLAIDHDPQLVAGIKPIDRIANDHRRRIGDRHHHHRTGRVHLGVRLHRRGGYADKAERAEETALAARRRDHRTRGWTCFGDRRRHDHGGRCVLRVAGEVGFRPGGRKLFGINGRFQERKQAGPPLLAR
jgi:hypothetical protein